MKQYGLYMILKSETDSINSNRELVYTIRTETIDEAISLFAERKKLSKRDLLTIFDVKETK